MTLVDLHCHTAEKSDDSRIRLERYVELAAERSVDVVCITDHDRFWSPERLSAVSDASGVRLLPGCEINTDAGHVLCFGLVEYTFGFHRPERLRSAVELAGASAVWAHPYRRNLPHGADPVGLGPSLASAAANPLIKWVDSVETANGRGDELQNRFSVELARFTSSPQSGGSDAHDEIDFGSAMTEFDADIDSLTDLIAALKSGRYRAAHADS